MDYSDFPTEEKKPPVKLIAIIGGSVVVLIVIVFVVLRLVSGDPPYQGGSGGLGEPTETTTQPSCENADDKAGCEANLAKQLSQQNKDITLCEDLQETDRDDCIWGVADQMLDDSLCKKMVNEDWVIRCQDGVIRKTAIDKKKESICDKIQSEDTKALCIEDVLGQLTSANCKQRGADPAVCNMLLVVDKANSLQDRRLCDSLPAEYVSACREKVVSDDPDFDGISTEIEVSLFGSDPYLADTDGDGYSDLDEINAGYSPTGPGPL